MVGQVVGLAYVERQAGTLPPGWVMTTVGDVLNLHYGKGLPAGKRDDTGTIPVYGSNGIVGCHASALTNGPSIILGRKGSAGAVHLSRVPCWPIDTTYYTRPPEGIVLEYVYYALGNLNLGTLDKSTAIPGLNRDDAYVQPFPLPPTSEQERIVEAIEMHLTRLGACTAGLKAIQAKLKRYRAAVLKAAVEGTLTAAWRAQHPDVEPASVLLQRILQERRNAWEQAELAKYAKVGKAPPKGWQRNDKPLAVPDASDPPELPQGWCWTYIGQVAECLDYARVPVNKEDRSKRGGDIPYYGANGQVGWIDNYLFDEPLVLVVEDESFIGREKPFSYKISGKAWVNNHAHVLRPLDAVMVDYLNYALMYYPFTPLTTGSTGRRKLTQAGLMSAPFKLPPLPEQEQIIAEVDRRLSVVAEIEAQIQAELKRAERLRQSILKEAFAGRLVPQDPEDEPADMLLKRIRIQKVGRTTRRVDEQAVQLQLI